MVWGLCVFKSSNGVNINGRVVPAALAASCNISADRSLVDGVGCIGSCVAEREKWVGFVQLKLTVETVGL